MLPDNLGAPRPKRISDLIEEWGAELVFRPTYSPALNPTEEESFKIRTFLGSSGARTYKALLGAAEESLSAIACNRTIYLRRCYQTVRLGEPADEKGLCVSSFTLVEVPNRL